MRVTRKTILTLIICTLFTLIATSVAGYSLSPSSSQDTIDIVDREINNEIGSATISSVSTITSDDSVAVEVGVDSDEMNPNLQVRDQENSILRLRRDVQDGSIQTFDSSVFVPSGQSGTTAGTYSISLWFDGEAVAAHPVVVQGYDISIKSPSTASPTETVDITADISERNIPKNSDPKSVELTIGNKNAAIQKEKSIIEGKIEYSFEVDADKLEEKEYNVYTAVRGNKKVLGKNELLAINGGSKLKVTESDGSGGNETDENNETTATNIDISNVSFEPDTVSNAQGEYTLSFNVSNVSTDGKADEFSVSIPAQVDIKNVENMRVNKSEYDPNTTVTNNSVEFSVNPGPSTHPENLSIQLDLTLTT